MEEQEYLDPEWEEQNREQTESSGRSTFQITGESLEKIEDQLDSHHMIVEQNSFPSLQNYDQIHGSENTLDVESDYYNVNYAYDDSRTENHDNRLGVKAPGLHLTSNADEMILIQMDDGEPDITLHPDSSNFPLISHNISMDEKSPVVENPYSWKNYQKRKSLPASINVRSSFTSLDISQARINEKKIATQLMLRRSHSARQPVKRQKAPTAEDCFELPQKVEPIKDQYTESESRLDKDSNNHYSKPGSSLPSSSKSLNDSIEQRDDQNNNISTKSLENTDVMQSLDGKDKLASEGSDKADGKYETTLVKLRKKKPVDKNECGRCTDVSGYEPHRVGFRRSLPPNIALPALQETKELEATSSPEIKSEQNKVINHSPLKHSQSVRESPRKSIPLLPHKSFKNFIGALGSLKDLVGGSRFKKRGLFRGESLGNLSSRNLSDKTDSSRDDQGGSGNVEAEQKTSNLSRTLGESFEEDADESREVILRGGAPWGFTVDEESKGMSPGWIGGIRMASRVFIAKVDGDHRSATSLRAGDTLLSVNRVGVRSRDEAEQLIDSAFSTLTLTIKRGQFEQNAPPKSSSYTNKTDDNKTASMLPGSSPSASITQDDSFVGRESKEVKTRPTRRVESFNLRTPPRSSSWQPPGTPASEPPAGTNKRWFPPAGTHRTADVHQRHVSASALDVSSHTNMQHPSGGSSHSGSTSSGLHSMSRSASYNTSTPSLHQYKPWNAGIASSSSSSAHQIAAPDNTSIYNGNAPVNNATSSESNTWEYGGNNKTEFLDNKENLNKLEKSYSTTAIKANKSYSDKWSRSGNNYENISALEVGYNGIYQSKSSPSVPVSVDTHNAPSQHTAVPEHPPTPPARDSSSSFFKSRNNETHEKFPSWPHSEKNPEDKPGGSSKSGSSSRSGSWSESTSSADFPAKPKLTYQPMLNTHLEERMSSKDVKRFLEENRLKKPRDTELQPMLAKVNYTESFPYLYNTSPRETFPLEKYRSEQLEKGGGGQQHSPPERDVPLDRYDELRNKPEVTPPLPRSPPPVGVTSGLSYDFTQTVTQTTSTTSPMLRVTQSHHHHQQQQHTLMQQTTSSTTNPLVEKSPTYMYIARNKPCYNTSTQTESEDSSGAIVSLKSSPAAAAPVAADPAPGQAQSGSDVELKHAEVQVDQQLEKGGSSSEMVRTAGVSSQLNSQYNSMQGYNSSSQHQSGGNNQFVHGASKSSQYAGHSSSNKSHSMSQSEEDIEFSKELGNITYANSNADLGTPGHRAPIIDKIPEDDELLAPLQSEPSSMEDELAKIHDHAPSQTVMLRKLSQEFFGQKSKPAMSKLNIQLQKDGKPQKVSSEESSGSKSSQDSTSQPMPVTPLNPTTPENDVFIDGPPLSQPDQKPLFGRATSSYMSLRKAFGTFDPIDMTERPFMRKPIGTSGKSASTSQVPSHLQHFTFDVVSKTNKDVEIVEVKTPKNMDSRQIAENARMEWAQKHKKLPSPQLKRTTSEQIRPLKDKHKISDPDQQEDIKRHKVSDSCANIYHGRQKSDPETMKQKRMSSTSDSVFSTDGNQDGRSRPSSVRSNASNSSDPAKALLSFYEKKTGKRVSSSSMDSSNSSERTPKKDNTQNFHYSESESGSRINSNAESDMLSPPDLLDTLSGPRGPVSSGPGSDYSPPLHPWGSERQNSRQDELDEAQDEDTTHPKYMEAMNDPASMQSTSPVAPPRAYERSVSSSSTTSYHVTVNKPGYHDNNDENDDSPPPQLPPRNYRPNKDKRSAPPAPQIPTKQRSYSEYKYNGHNSSSSLQQQQQQQQQPNLPEPQLPVPNHHQRSSSYSHDSRRSTGSSSGSSGSLTMTMTDYDATPKPDYYADQLRAQARKQSQSLGLHPARGGYQKSSKVSVVPATVAVSRPVDRPPQMQEAQPVIPVSSAALQSSAAAAAQMYRANNVQKGLNFVGLSPPDGSGDNHGVGGSDLRNNSPVPAGNDSPGSRGSYGHQDSHQYTPPGSNRNSSYDNHSSPQQHADYPAGQRSSLDLPGQRSSYGSNHSNTANEPGSRGSYHSNPDSQQQQQQQYRGGYSGSSGSQPSAESQPQHGSSSRYFHHSPQASQLSDPGLSSLSQPSSRGSYHSPQASLLSDPGSHRSDPGSSSRTSFHSPQASIVSTVTSGYHSPKTDSSGGSRRVSDPSRDEYGREVVVGSTFIDDAELAEGAHCDENRYSNESYLVKKNNYTRQGFGGNYRRKSTDNSPTKSPTSPQFPQFPTGASTAPTSQSQSISITTPTTPLSSTSSEQRQYASNAAAGSMTLAPGSQDSSMEVKQGGVLNHQPPWGNNRARFYGPKPFKPATGNNGDQSVNQQNSQMANQGAYQLHPSPPRVELTQNGDEAVDSPSVRSVVRNFEVHSRDTASILSSKEPINITKSKIAELRETLVRKSNENLFDAAKDNVSRSNENVHRLSPTRLEFRQDKSNESQNVSQHEDHSGPPEHAPPPVPSEDTADKYAPQQHSYSARLRGGDQEQHVSHLKETDNTKVVQMQSISSPPHYAPPPPPPSHSQQQQQKTDSSSPPSNNNHKQSTASPPRNNKPASTTNTPPAQKSPQVPPPQAPAIQHVRQKSQEEIACEQQAALVVRQLGDHERHLSDVILPPPDHRQTTDYISGLFDTRVDVTRTPSLRVNSRPAVTVRREEADRSVNEVTSPTWSPSKDSDPAVPIEKQKEQLVELAKRIEKKLSILREEKSTLSDEIEDNNLLGKELAEIVEKKVPNSSELEKYRSYVRELEMVMTLLLNLSGRLARAENALRGDSISEREKTFLKSKRENCHEKLEDAKQLKSGIDHRGNQVAGFLRNYLTADEFEDYEHFIKMKSKLNMDQQEVDDKIRLGEEQLTALQKSISAESNC